MQIISQEVPNGCPNPTRYLVFLSIPNPTRFSFENHRKQVNTRSSWLNCALRDDEAVYCVSIGHYEAVAVAVDDTGSVEGIHAFIYCTKWTSGQVSPMPD